MKEQDFFIHDSITFSKGIELVTKLKDTYSILQKSKEASSFNKFSQFEPPNFLCKKSLVLLEAATTAVSRNMTAQRRLAERRERDR